MAPSCATMRFARPLSESPTKSSHRMRQMKRTRGRRRLSSGSQERRAEMLGELARELRQFNGLGASFFRAAAARIGMTVTDMQVIDILQTGGPMTAGQLADLTGLTTGAI